jgi:hypothetical protein
MHDFSWYGGIDRVSRLPLCGLGYGTSNILTSDVLMIYFPSLVYDGSFRY